MTEYIFKLKHKIESCLYCPAKRDDYNVCNLAGEEIPNTDRVADFCPLKELPPHGRLIDADAFISSTKDTYGEKELTGQRGTLHVPLGGVFKEYVDEEPTILESNR